MHLKKTNKHKLKPKPMGRRTHDPNDGEAEKVSIKVKKTNGISSDSSTVTTRLQFQILWSPIPWLNKNEIMKWVIRIGYSCVACSGAFRLSARHHAAESGEASFPLSDQRVWSQIQQAAVVWNTETLCDGNTERVGTKTTKWYSCLWDNYNFLPCL